MVKNPPIKKTLPKNYEVLPDLVPVQAEGYSLAKKIVPYVYLRERTHTIYHVWLDCLYEANVTFKNILDELKSLLNTNDKQSCLHKGHIFIVGHKITDGTVLPAGSCYLLLNNAVQNQSQSRDFELDIFQNGVHMMKVDVASVRQQLKERQTLIFARGHINIIPDVPIKALMKACKASSTPIESIPTTSKNPSVTTNDSLKSNKNSSVITNNPAKNPKNPPQPNSAPVKPKASTVTNNKMNQPKEQPIPKPKKPTVNPPVQQPVLVKSEPALVIEFNNENKPEFASDESDDSFGNLSGSEFVPVTSETLFYALKIMKKYELEERVVAIVFDPCFSLPDLTINSIRNKFGLIFGQIGDDCVLIKSNLDNLMPNLDAAYARNFTAHCQAYIIGSSSLKLDDMVRVANEHQILFGSMTMSCVIMNLKKGIYLMKREALHAAGAPIHSLVRDAHLDSTTSKESRSTSTTSSGSKRNRFAATMNGTSLKISKPKTNGSNGTKEFSADLQQKLLDKMEDGARRDDFVSNNLPKLLNLGNTVMKIDNLPAKLSVHALNLMMGTYSITSEQVVAVIVPYKKGQDLMNIRIVMRSNCDDVHRIASKNKCKTAYNTVLLIKRTDLKELEAFLRKNYDRIYKLSADSILPIASISYGKN